MPIRTTAPYFCDYVLHLLLNNPAYGADAAERERKIFRGGLTIKTTLDPKAQSVAQAQVDGSAGANPDKWGASLVSVQPGSGKIVSMAQNTVWFPADGKFDQPRTSTWTCRTPRAMTSTASAASSPDPR